MPSESTGCQSKAVFCFSPGLLSERKLIFVQDSLKQKYETMAMLKQTLQVMSLGRKRTAPVLVFIGVCQKLSGCVSDHLSKHGSVDLCSPVRVPLVPGAVAVTQEE